MPAQSDVVRFKITLDAVKPTVMRRIEVVHRRHGLSIGYGFGSERRLTLNRT